MIRKIAIAAAFLMIPVFCFQAAEPAKEKEAVASAEKWLSLVDEGKYTESWEEASGYLKKAVSAEQWIEAAETFRKPLGKLISRKVKTTTYATSLPGAPAGEYVVIEFETSFENKKTAVETVTPVLDEDGSWRVSGYYIK